MKETHFNFPIYSLSCLCYENTVEVILVTAETTILGYWLNWRVLLCAFLVLVSIVFAFYLIWRYECKDHLGVKDEEVEVEKSRVDEAWMPCIKQIHPIWLLVFRVMAFILLLANLIAKISVAGPEIFFFYTQWTFTLLTIYFGLGSLLSVYGCLHNNRTNKDFIANCEARDAEGGPYFPLLNEQTTDPVGTKYVDAHEDSYFIRIVSISGHAFQILFQLCGGAVIFTDCIYWSVIFPLQAIKLYSISFLTVNFHTLNVVLLLGDAALNSLRFPWFRIAYFALWTGTFVIFQWIIHACVSVGWPYPFLDLSSPYAPLWYLLIGLMQVPCYSIFPLIIRVKQDLLSKWFASSPECAR